MQRVSISHVIPGMVVARNVFGADGRLLLANGLMLTNKYIRRLKHMGILSVYARNPFFEDVEVPEIMREEVRVEAVKRVQKGFQQFRITQTVDAEQLQKTAQGIVDEVLRNPQVMVHIAEIRTHDDYTFVHSVNVCALAVMIGALMGYNISRLYELALGALFHDMGKMMIPQAILNKPGRLDDEEMKIIRYHPGLGFEFLRKKHSDLSLLAMHVVFQHQEKYDGSGYPRGLSQKEIHEYARIVAIADVYDAISSDRPYRPGMLPHKAYEIMAASMDTHFDGQILAVFLRNVAIYPVGCVVQLTTGDYGVVVNVRSGLQSRPTVRLIANKERKSYEEKIEIDLTENLTTVIVRVVPEEEVFAMKKECECN